MRVGTCLRQALCCTIALFAAPHLASGVEVSTTGVYDSTGGNEVERNGSGNAFSSTAPNDYLGFKADVAAAFAANRGGVITFAEAVGGVGTGDNTFDAKYGTLAQKIVTVSSDVTHNTTTSTGFGATLSTGTLYLVSSNVAGNGPDFTFTFGPITGGEPGEFVQRVAVTILDKALAADTDVTLTASFSDGQSAPLTIIMPTDATTLNPDTFVAFSAPAGTSITSLGFDFVGTNTNTSRFGIDDLAFITAVPEPGAGLLLLACAFPLVRRRRLAPTV